MNKLEKYLSDNNFSYEKINQIKNIFDKLKFKNDVKNKLVDYIINNDIKTKNINKNINQNIPLDPFFNSINNYQLNDTIANIIGIMNDKYILDEYSGLFGKYDQQLIDKATSNLDKYGYYIFDHKLDKNVCDKILEHAKKFKYFNKIANKTIDGINLQNPIATTHWIIDQTNIVNIPEIQDLITDPTILTICQNYLKSIPINSQTNLWYSVKYDKIKDQTQKFHQDYDDVKFIKLFIYLSDVTKKNGPHTYIKSSRTNRITPKDYKVSKRLEDNYVQKIYKNDIVEFTGEQGTIIFEDTNGFHKGKAVDEGYRIILQLEFTTSLLWMNEKVLQTNNVQFKDDKIEFINKFNKIYIKYL